MGTGTTKLNMSHPFPSYFLFSDFNTATVTDNTFIPDPFIFSAMTFPIFYRTKNPFTEQSIPFGLVSPVIDCFRLKNFTAAIFQGSFPEKQD